MTEIILLILVAICGGLGGYGVAEIGMRHYRQRWRSQIEVINNLQDELAAKETVEVVPIPMRSLAARTEPVRAAPAAPGEPWKVSVRTIRGTTSVYAKRGVEMEELARVLRSSPKYQDELGIALMRARHTVELKNSSH